MKSIQSAQLHLPPHVPVMFLPHCVLLPHVLLPLFIFEPRYRSMLTQCLKEDRQFCVALLQPGVTEVSTSEDYHEIAGIGLVRACVGHEDGTSHLVLQGLGRVRLRGFIQDKPFRVAEVRELVSIPTTDPEVPGLCERIKKIASVLLPAESPDRQKLNEQLAEIDDAGMLCDVVAHTFVREAAQQQLILEELEISDRVRRLVSLLERQLAE